MTTDEQQMTQRAAEKGKDPRTRWIIILLGLIAVLSLLAAIATGIYAWSEASKNAEAGKTLAQDVRQNCDASPTFSAENPDLCDVAVAVEKETVEIDDPEHDDPDPNDPELQESEIQNSEIQDREVQNREIQNPEVDQREIQEKEEQEPEIDDAPIPGKPGQDGKNAEPISDEQRAQDLAEYCSARGDCLGPKGEQGPEGPPGQPGRDGQDATCEGSFVCQDELDSVLANYLTGVQVMDLLRALGCETTAEGPGQILTYTCTITGKP